MAVSIGDIEFAIKANTEALDKVSKVLQTVAKNVDKMAGKLDRAVGKIDKGFTKASKSAKSFGTASTSLMTAQQRLQVKLKNQETAARKLEKQYITMRDRLIALNKAGVNTGNSMGTLSASFKRINQQAVGTKAGFGAAEVQMAGFRKTIAGTERQLAAMGFTNTRVGRQMQDAGKNGDRLTKIIRDLQSASVLAVGPLSGLGARVQALGSIFARTGKGGLVLAGVIGGAAGITVGLIKLIKDSISAAAAMDKINASLRVATGTSFAANDAFKFVSDTAKELGLDLNTAATQYGKMAAAARGTELQGAKLQQIFTGVATATGALNLTADQTTGVFRALEQMISKGNVQAEELRGQLGERLPGAFGLAAKALGVTTKELNKMLEDGEVLANDLLPKLANELVAAFSEQAAKNANKLTQEINRLKTAYFELTLAINDSAKTGSAWTKIIVATRKAVESVTENIEGWITTLLVAAGAIAGLGLGFLVKTILESAAALVKVSAKLSTFVAWLAKISPVGLVAIGVITALAAAMALLGDEIKTSFDFGDIDQLKKLTDAFKELDSLNPTQFRGLNEVQQQTQRAIAIRLEQISKLQTELDGITKSQTALGDLELEAQTKYQEKLKLAISLLEAEIAELSTLEELQAKLAKLPLVPEPPSKEFLDGLDEAKTLLQETANAQELLNAARSGGTMQAAIDAQLRWTESLQEARDLIKDAKKEGDDFFKGFSSQFGGKTGKALEEAVASEIDEVTRTTDEVARRKEAPQLIQDLNDKFKDLNQKHDTFKLFPIAVEELNAEFERKEAVEEYQKILEKIPLDMRNVGRSTDEYRKKLEEVAAAEKIFKRNEKLIKELVKVYDRAGEGFIEALQQGEDAGDSFRNVMVAVLADIQRAILEAFVFDPIKKFIEQSIQAIIDGQNSLNAASSASSGGGLFGLVGSFFSGFLGSFGGGGLGPQYTGTGAEGLANQASFQHGGITGPGILINSRGVATVGEAGPEAIMPLGRDSSGNLGVHGGGGNNVTIIIDARGSNGDAAVEAAVARGIRRATPFIVDGAVAKVWDTGSRSI